MTGLVDSREDATAARAAPPDQTRFVGVVTRAVSWVMDALVINVVAIACGLGVELVFSIFPVSPNAGSVLKPIAGAAYLLWTVAYFVFLWSWTGQTVGARVMRIRLLTAKQGRVKPARAFVRWVGMNLAMVPLFAGYAPILFGRRGFPDWLARTEVIEAQQESLAEMRLATIRAASVRPPRTPSPSPGSEPDASARRDGDDPPTDLEPNLGIAASD